MAKTKKNLLQIEEQEFDLQLTNPVLNTENNTFQNIATKYNLSKDFMESFIELTKRDNRLIIDEDKLTELYKISDVNLSTNQASQTLISLLELSIICYTDSLVRMFDVTKFDIDFFNDSNSKFLNQERARLIDNSHDLLTNKDKDILERLFESFFPFLFLYIKEELIKRDNFKKTIGLIEAEKSTKDISTQPQKEIVPIDSTLHQQFLVFHYLFKHLDIRTNEIDKTQIARFIQFATQKQLEAKKIQNTSIYKLVDNPFNGYKKDNGTIQTNLQKVRELFESLGLKQIAEIVSKDIV